MGLYSEIKRNNLNKDFTYGSNSALTHAPDFMSTGSPSKVFVVPVGVKRGPSFDMKVSNSPSNTLEFRTFTNTYALNPSRTNTLNSNNHNGNYLNSDLIVVNKSFDALNDNSNTNTANRQHLINELNTKIQSNELNNSLKRVNSKPSVDVNPNSKLPPIPKRNTNGKPNYVLSNNKNNSLKVTSNLRQSPYAMSPMNPQKELNRPVVNTNSLDKRFYSTDVFNDKV